MRPALRLRKEALTELGPDDLRAVAGGTEPTENICFTFAATGCTCQTRTRLCLTSPSFGAAD